MGARTGPLCGNVSSAGAGVLGAASVGSVPSIFTMPAPSAQLRHPRALGTLAGDELTEVPGLDERVALRGLAKAIERERDEPEQHRQHEVRDHERDRLGSG